MSSSSEATNLVYESTFSSTIVINVVLVAAVLLVFFALKSLFPSFYEPMRHMRSGRSRWGSLWFVDVFLQPYEQFAKRGNLAMIYVVYQTMLLSLFFILSILACVVLIPTYYFGTDQAFVINHATNWSKISLPHLAEDSAFYILVFLVCIVYSMIIMAFYESFHKVYIYFRQRTLRRSCPQNYTVLLSYLPATINTVGTLERVAREAYGPDLAKVVPVPKGCKELDRLFAKLAGAARGETLAQHRAQHWHSRIEFLRNEIIILARRIARAMTKMHVAGQNIRRGCSSPGATELAGAGGATGATTRNPVLTLSSGSAATAAGSFGSSSAGSSGGNASDAPGADFSSNRSSSPGECPDSLEEGATPQSQNAEPPRERRHVHPFKRGILRIISLSSLPGDAASGDGVADTPTVRNRPDTDAALQRAAYPAESLSEARHGARDGALEDLHSPPQDAAVAAAATPSRSQRARSGISLVWRILCLTWELVSCAVVVGALLIALLVRALDLACTKSYHARAIASVRRCVGREREIRLSCLVLAAQEGLTLDYLFVKRAEDVELEAADEARRQLLAAAGALGAGAAAFAGGGTSGKAGDRLDPEPKLPEGNILGSTEGDTPAVASSASSVLAARAAEVSVKSEEAPGANFDAEEAEESYAEDETLLLPSQAVPASPRELAPRIRGSKAFKCPRSSRASRAGEKISPDLPPSGDPETGSAGEVYGSEEFCHLERPASPSSPSGPNTALVGDLCYPPFSPGFLPSHVHEYDKLAREQVSSAEDWHQRAGTRARLPFGPVRAARLIEANAAPSESLQPAILPARMELKLRYPVSAPKTQNAEGTATTGAVGGPPASAERPQSLEQKFPPELILQSEQAHLSALISTRTLLLHALAMRRVKRRKMHASGKVYNHAFLIFRTQNSASLASQTLLYRNGTEPAVSLAPDVSKIQWKNINTPLYKRTWLMLAFSLVTLAVFAVYFVPQTALLTVVNIFSQTMMHWLYTFVCVDIPGEAGQCPRLALEQMSLVDSVEDFNGDYGCLVCYKLTNLVITYIPSVISAIVMSLLPIIMRGLAMIPQFVLISDKRNSEYRLIFYFLIIIQGVIQIVMPSALNMFGALDLSSLFTKSLSGFVTDMGRNLPSQIFNFLNYVITKYFLFSVLQLLRPGDIFLVLLNSVRYAHSGVSSANKYLGRKYRGFPFAKQSAYASHMFTIGLLYSLVAPISLPIITAVYAIMTITDRYNILYVYPPAPESDVASQTDLMKYVASNTYVGFVAMILVTICFFSILGGWMSRLGIVVFLVDFVFVIIQKVLIDKKYKRAMTVMPLAANEATLAAGLASELSMARRGGRRRLGSPGRPGSGLELPSPSERRPEGAGAPMDDAEPLYVGFMEGLETAPEPLHAAWGRRGACCCCCGKERAAARNFKRYRKKAGKAVEDGAGMNLPVSYMQRTSLYSNRVQLAVASEFSIGNKRLSDQDINGVAMVYTHPAIASSMLEGVLCPAEPTL